MATPYDAIIIGTGQAGPALAQRMNREGLKVAVVERKLMGGTCVNVGCIPTKTLVASARVAHMARRSDEFGIQVDGPVGVDMKRVKARMKEISGQSNTNVTRWLDGMETYNPTLAGRVASGKVRSLNKSRYHLAETGDDHFFVDLVAAGGVVLESGDLQEAVRGLPHRHGDLAPDGECAHVAWYQRCVR